MKTTTARIVPFSNHLLGRTRGACSVTVVVTVIGIGAIVFGALNGGRGAVWLGLIALALFLITGTGVFPYTLAARLQRPYQIKQPEHVSFGTSVCVILLGEGSVSHPDAKLRSPSWIAGSRVVMAAALHRAAQNAGASSRILIAGERTRSDGEFDASYRRVLSNLGVSDSDIVEEDKGVNTYQHARNICPRIVAQPVEKLCLVTSALHMRRALLYFGAFGLKPEPFPSDYIHVPRLLVPVGYNFAVADIAVHQYIGIFRFHVYEALGLNRRASLK